MRIIMTVLGFMFGVLCLQAQKVSFTETVIEYGDIAKNSDGKRIFKYKNIGQKPLIISNISSTCGCAIPSWTRTPIAPGKEGMIEVVYDTKILGNFSKSIEVYSNDIDSPRKLLRIKGNVK